MNKAYLSSWYVTVTSLLVWDSVYGPGKPRPQLVQCVVFGALIVSLCVFVRRCIYAVWFSGPLPVPQSDPVVRLSDLWPKNALHLMAVYYVLLLVVGLCESDGGVLVTLVLCVIYLGGAGAIELLNLIVYLASRLVSQNPK